MNMSASNAMKILASHPSMMASGALLGGGGALVYNSLSQPVLDEYGNVIESNDINPLIAAGIGGAIGLAGSTGLNYVKGRQPQSPGGTSQPMQQTPQSADDRFNEIKAEVIREKINDFRSEVGDLRNELRNYQEQNQQPVVVRVPSNPLKQQNPANPHGGQIVLVRPVDPVQNSLDELQILQAIAETQGNPPQPTIPPTQYFDDHPYVRTIVTAPTNDINANLAYQTEEALNEAYQRQQRAKRDMSIGGWNNSKANYNTLYPEDNQYPIAGWDLIDPSPEGIAWNRELNLKKKIV